jgi:hypothetical protein
MRHAGLVATLSREIGPVVPIEEMMPTILGSPVVLASRDAVAEPAPEDGGPSDR